MGEDRVTVAQYAGQCNLSIGQVYSMIRRNEVVAVKQRVLWVFPKLTEERIRSRALEETEARLHEKPSGGNVAPKKAPARPRGRKNNGMSIVEQIRNFGR